MLESFAPRVRGSAARPSPGLARRLGLVRRLAPLLALLLLISSPSAATAATYLRWPLPYGTGQISQYFTSGHKGIDIRAPRGTSVYAAHAGRVQFAGWKSNGGGYQVWIRHGDGRSTTYNHMAYESTYAGVYVSRGQRIGAVGCCGWCSGNHLHFELWIGPVWNGGYSVNPRRYM